MSNMIGIDEVGRGCWAGPLLVVAARQKFTLPATVADSKTISRKKRELLFEVISQACDIGEGWVTASEIDALGLTEAMRLAVRRALEALNAKEHETIIMDGNINYCAPRFINSQAVIDADATHPVVSAASIYAKVQRDRFMAQQSTLFPGYAFEKHVGYGTAAHAGALRQLGLCSLHRRSFKPIKAFL